MLRKLTHMLSCREATRLLSQRQERALTTIENVKLRLHLVVCVACTRFARQLAFLRTALARYRT
jgi:putative zinc finger protein